MANTPKTPSSTGKRSRADDGGGNNKRATPKSKGDDVGPAKASKGLRHFSMKVCKKVEEKGQTSYNEVADELVKEFMIQRAAESSSSTTTPPQKKPGGKNQPAYDEKNIRRRVYDALNVLMAMDIISKEKKEITWKGLPNNASHDLEMLEREKELRLRELKRKRECLQELLVQQICFRNLIQRNRQKEGLMEKEKERISLPFIVINTSCDSEILCKGAADWTDVMFDFSHPFEINDDNEILKRLGLDKTSPDELRRMLPHDLLTYCQKHHLLDSIVETAPSHMPVQPYSSHRSNMMPHAHASPNHYDSMQGLPQDHRDPYY